MPRPKENIGLILLAAGGSTRMGKPKQLLPIDGTSLVRRETSYATLTACSPITVVLGAHYEQIQSELINLPVTIAINSGWSSGVASSIRTGLICALEKNSRLDAVLLMLCDQPNITDRSLNQLLDSYHSRPDHIGIIAAKYDGQLGVPVIFSKQYFSDLRTLSGDTGAKKLLKRYQSCVLSVQLPEASLDLDTFNDFASTFQSDDSSRST
jgi:molybdenum cofactor cytidylyltransferase